jgi:hypothetical protein
MFYIKSSKQDLAKFYNLDRPLAKEIQNLCLSDKYPWGIWLT